MKISPKWDVELSPGGPTVVLNGTIAEVREEVLKLILLQWNSTDRYLNLTSKPNIPTGGPRRYQSSQLDFLGGGDGGGGGGIDDRNSCLGHQKAPECPTNVLRTSTGSTGFEEEEEIYVRNELEKILTKTNANANASTEREPGKGKYDRFSCFQKSAIWWARDEVSSLL